MNERIRQMLLCAELWYRKGKNKTQIAEYLNCDRATVARLLGEAKELGFIIEPEVIFNFPRLHTLETNLRRRYDLKGVRVIPVVEEDIVKDNIAAQLAKDLNDILRNISAAKSKVEQSKVKLGVSGGSTLQAVAAKFPEHPFPALTIFPIGVSMEPKNIHADSVAAILSYKLKESTSYALQVPPIVWASGVNPAEEKERFLNMAHVQEILKQIKAIDVAVVGISTIKGGESFRQLCKYLMGAGILPEDALMQLENEMVGEILHQVFRADGSFEPRNNQIVQKLYDQTVIALTLTDLRKMVDAGKDVILAATGEEKTDAIAAALRGKLVNWLYTDERVASKLEKDYPGS